MLTLADLEACAGLASQLRLLDGYARLDRPIVVRGETSTSRAAISRLSAEENGFEVYCPLLPNSPGALWQVLEQNARRLSRRGLVSFIEVDRLSVDDQRLMTMVARDRVIDARGTPLTSRLVCQFDPRVGSPAWTPGAFLELDLPPLAMRPDDAVGLLTRLLARHLGNEVRLDELAVEAVATYAWPGDVAELISRAEQIAARWPPDAGRPVVRAEQLGIPHVTAANRRARTQATEGRTLAAIIEEYEAEVIMLVMVRLAGNKSQAARELGISRSYLIQKCQKYGIE